MITISDEEYAKLTDYMYRNYGIKLGEHKKALVVGRLQSVLMQNNFRSFSEYLDYVFSDKTGNALITLINRITTNHTSFMREPEHFNFLRDKVLPYLVNTVKSKDLRIWSAGCSNGAEAYTIAMVLQEFFGSEKPLWDTRILATDISQKVLDTAKKGEYSNKDIATVPPHWKNKYFDVVDDEKVVVSDRIKNEVIFRSFNLMNEVFPFKKNVRTKA